jgi:hypothetical protein
MKSVLVFAMGLVLSGSVLALDLKNAGEYEYVHCVPMQVAARKTTVHYVVDVRNPQKYQLYTATPAQQNVKAVNLQRLRQIDPLMVQTQSDSWDLVWKSNPARLQFNLNIADSNGQLLIGNLVGNRRAVDIKCIDIALEK